MSAPGSRADWTTRGRRFAAAAPAPLGLNEERRRAFAAARRHSRLVLRLRVAAPVGLALGVAAVTLGAVFNPFREKAGELSIGELAISGPQITMGRPKLSGFRRDGSAYVVNAAKAIQDVTRPTLVELRDVDGELEMGDNGLLHVAAEIGFYDSVHEIMDLTQNVRLHNPAYDVTLKSAKIDFKSGLYASDEPVRVEMSNGTTIVADSVVARNRGEELTFSGHVRSAFPARSRSPAEAKESAP